MLPCATDRDNARPMRWGIPPWDRNSAEWLAIEHRLAPDHPARLIDYLVAKLDLTDVRTSYAGRGSPPHPPELLLRLALFEFWEGELSPAKWHDHCRELDPAKWLLFGLRPSLSSLYAFLARCAGLVDGLNRQLLQMARAEGLVTGDDVAFDGTFVATRGSRHRLVTAKIVHKRLEQLDAALAADYAPTSKEETPNAESSVPALPPPEVAAPVGRLCSAPADTSPATSTGGPVATIAVTEVTTHASSSSPAVAHRQPPPKKAESPYWMAKTPATRLKQRQRYRLAGEMLKHKHQRHQQTLSRTAKAKRRSVERIVICPTEPEAALGRDKLKTFRPLYNVQWAHDVDARYVVGYNVVASATDDGQFGPLARSVESLCGHRPKRVAVDEKYAGPVDLALARELKITVHAPTSTTMQADGSCKKPKQGMIPKQEFLWLDHEQTYRCPQGHLLRLVRSGTQTRAGGETLKLMQYRCPAEHCRTCPVQSKCTRTPEQGRIVKRSEHDELVEELRARMQSPESQEFYRERKQTVELGFADLKEHRGLRRFHSFGLTRARTQVAMLVLAVNGMAFAKACANPAARPRGADEEARASPA